MARRYIKITGLGRCSIILEGVNQPFNRRVRLAKQLGEERVYFVKSIGARNCYMDVTEAPIVDILRLLDEYDWIIPMGSVEGADEVET